MRISTTFFGPIAWYRLLANASEPVMISPSERFVKQTERSRCRIATANGVQTLSVPVSYSNGAPVQDVRIAEHSNWRHTYWQALSSAYGSSPFFEYYADDIHPFFEKRWEWLYDYNMEIMHTMCKLTDIHPTILTTATEIGSPPETPDDKQEEGKPYYQTFQQRHGFLSNLSILDLLFNMGPETILHLKK